jgi:hypothetical protein
MAIDNERHIQGKSIEDIEKLVLLQLYHQFSFIVLENPQA